MPISYDIETPNTSLEVDESELDVTTNVDDVRNINSIQFSIRENTGIFFNWTGEFIEIAKAILKLPNDKIGWNNWRLDTASIKYHLGNDAISGTNMDIMWGFKFLNQDFVKLGRGLQFATNFYASNIPAWKHISGSDSTRYGCIDVDSVVRIYNGLKKDLQSRRFDCNSKSLWEGYIDDVVKLRPILDNITRRGFPVDIAARSKYKEKVQRLIKENNIEIQHLYPKHLRKTDPLEGFKRTPKEVEELTSEFQKLRNIESDGKYLVSSIEDKILLEKFIEFSTRRIKKKGEKGEKQSGLVLREFKIEDRIEKRWCHIELFKPNSTPQVIAYLEYKKYKIPTKRELGKLKQTSGKDEISLLAEDKNDRLLNLIIEQRELKKILTTYLGEGKKGWKLGEDNRLHGEFNFIPKTGQLGCMLHNAPKRGTRFSSKGYKELAEEFRGTITAKPNHTLLSCDWKSFHALTLGFEANDEKYISLVRKDIHSYIAAFLLREEFPDKLKKLQRLVGRKLVLANMEEANKLEEGILKLNNLDNWLNLNDSELISNLKWIKNNYKFTRDSQAKPCILGIGFGEGVKKVFKLNSYSFQSLSQVEILFKYLQKEFPKIFAFQEYIIKLADAQTYLITRYGYIRRFYDVYDYRLLKEPRSQKWGEKIFRDTKGNWWSRNQGTQANEAIAFLPANNAFGKKKEAMRDLEELELLNKYRLVMEIHDDLSFECPNEYLDEAMEVVPRIMSSPARCLINETNPSGLICDVDISIGRNWNEMKEVKK